MQPAINSSEYWDKRVKGIPNRKDMLFLDGRRDEYWRRVRHLLSLWSNRLVLDVCCGFGQFADAFSRYEGLDFSQEMLALAKKDHPQKKFILGDARNPDVGLYDIVFEVNSLHSMGMTPEEFYEIYKSHAREFVMCLEADKFIIFQKYEERENKIG